MTGYPTLKFFKSGAEKEDGVKYRGNRDAAALEKFIAEKLGHEVPEEKPAAPESAEVAPQIRCLEIAVPCFPVVLQQLITTCLGCG